MLAAEASRTPPRADFQLEWPDQPVIPLQRAKLQLQSEGGEIYYRHLALLPLR